MRLGFPQTIWLILAILTLGIHLAKNGQQREDKYSFGMSLISLLINVWILYSGGFFN